MTEKRVEDKARRLRHSAEFKRQALLRATKDGVPAAARDLGLQPAQLYAWRGRALDPEHSCSICHETVILGDSNLRQLSSPLRRVVAAPRQFLTPPRATPIGLQATLHVFRSYGES